MRPTIRLALVLVLGIATTGCSLVYQLPTRQGNVIEQSQLNHLKLGMTKSQVSYLLGTPLAKSPFEKDRWDYVSYYQAPHGAVSKREVSLFFNAQGQLVRMTGVQINK